MSGSRITRGHDEGGHYPPTFRGRRWLRRALVVVGPLAALLIVFTVCWKLFVRYVPPGQHLVVISKNGTPLDADKGEVLADEGQKGIQKVVRGEGYHFVTPIVHATELRPNTAIPPGKVGIVTSLGGRRPRDGRVLADEDDEQGIRRQV